MLPQRGSACRDLPGSWARRLHAVTPVRGSASLPKLHSNKSVLLQRASVFSKLLVHLCLAQLARTPVKQSTSKKETQETQCTQSWATDIPLHPGHQGCQKSQGHGGVPGVAAGLTHSFWCGTQHRGVPEEVSSCSPSPSTHTSPTGLDCTLSTCPSPLQHSHAHVQ